MRVPFHVWTFKVNLTCRGSLLVLFIWLLTGKCSQMGPFSSLFSVCPNSPFCGFPSSSPIPGYSTASYTVCWNEWQEWFSYEGEKKNHRCVYGLGFLFCITSTELSNLRTSHFLIWSWVVCSTWLLLSSYLSMFQGCWRCQAETQWKKSSLLMAFCKVEEKGIFLFPWWAELECPSDADAYGYCLGWWETGEIQLSS